MSFKMTGLMTLPSYPLLESWKNEQFTAKFKQILLWSNDGIYDPFTPQTRGADDLEYRSSCDMTFAAFLPRWSS